MLDIKQLNKVMSERGFYQQMTSVKNNQIISVAYCTLNLDGMDISCTVDIIEGTFKFNWGIPKSINLLTTPECSPVLNDYQFYKIYNEMKKHVQILYNGLINSEVK